MAEKYDPSKAVGFEQSTVPVAWTTRDLLLYAVGIGAKKDDLRITYELDKNFAAFPTFPVVLSFKGENPDVVDFNKSITSSSVPGLPNFEPGRIVHGSQQVDILKPIPTSAGNGWKLKRRIVGVHENKSGVIVDNELTLEDPNGVPYTRMLSSTFNVGGKVTGTKFSKSIASGIQLSKPIPKDRAPDYVITEKVSEELAIIYRLSGDYNPLHIEPSVGARAGFGGVILHGLGSYGITARGILNAVAGGDPNALKTINARFTSPVKPGDTLETSVWEIGPGPDGTVELGFSTKNLATGKLSLGGGVAYVRRAAKSKL